MKNLANFTRHYPRPEEIQYWAERGYLLDPTPRAPSLDDTWKEKEIAGILIGEIHRIKAQGFDAILIGGLTNVMAYAWYIAQNFGVEVLYARGRRGENGYVITAYSRLLSPSSLIGADYGQVYKTCTTSGKAR